MTVEYEERGPEVIRELRGSILREFARVDRELDGRVEWHMLLSPDLGWPAQQEEIFLRSFLPAVRLPDGTAGSAVRVDLIGELSEGDSDPLELAERVRDRWAASEWHVHPLGPSYFRADRGDGAVMTIEARRRDDRALLSLTLQSQPMADRTDE